MLLIPKAILTAQKNINSKIIPEVGLKSWKLFVATAIFSVPSDRDMWCSSNFLTYFWRVQKFVKKLYTSFFFTKIKKKGKVKMNV